MAALRPSWETNATPLSRMAEAYQGAEARSYSPSFSERVGNSLQDLFMAGGMQPYPAGHLGRGLRDLMQLSPLGVPMAVGDFQHARQQGDTLGSILNAAAFIPGAKALGKYASYNARPMMVELDGAIKRRSVSPAGDGRFFIGTDGAHYTGTGTRADPLRAASEDAINLAYDDKQKYIQQVRERVLADRQKLTDQAEVIGDQFRAQGYKVNVSDPGDTTSRYLTVNDGRRDYKVRIADHPQPLDWVDNPVTGRSEYKVVGGYSREMKQRHPAADFSIDPETKLTPQDILAKLLSQ
jgi:hypothetical protein